MVSKKGSRNLGIMGALVVGSVLVLAVTNKNKSKQVSTSQSNFCWNTGYTYPFQGA